MDNINTAYEIPNLRFSLPAGEDIAYGKFVTIDANGKAIVATAAPVLGVATNEVSAGQTVSIADGIVTALAGAAVPPGTSVGVSASGTTSSTGTVAIALTNAAAAGDLITIKIL